MGNGGGLESRGGDGEGLDNTSCQGVAVLVNAHTYKGGGWLGSVGALSGRIEHY